MRYYIAVGRSLSVFVMILAIGVNAKAALVEAVFDDFTVQFDDAVMTLFGTPLVGGNTIFFLPNSFETSLAADGSSDSTRTAEIHDTVSFAVFPRGLNLLTGLNLVEQGDLTRIGSGPPDSFIIHGRVFVRDAFDPIDFVSTPFEHIVSTSDQLVLDVWEFGQPIDTGGFVTGAWITIENFLRVVDTGSNFSPIPNLPPPGGFGSEMFLQKKFIGFDVNVRPVPISFTSVPIPAALWFMSSALAMVGLLKRRSSV
jgi:hypothetical protein